MVKSSGKFIHPATLHGWSHTCAFSKGAKCAAFVAGCFQGGEISIWFWSWEIHQVHSLFCLCKDGDLTLKHLDLSDGEELENPETMEMFDSFQHYILIMSKTVCLFVFFQGAPRKRKNDSGLKSKTEKALRRFTFLKLIIWLSWAHFFVVNSNVVYCFISAFHTKQVDGFVVYTYLEFMLVASNAIPSSIWPFL